MLLLWGVVLGVAVGFIRGGTVANLEKLRLRFLWLVPISLVIQLLIFPLFSEQAIITFGTEFFHLFSYVILAIFVLINLQIWGIPLMGAGMGLNLLVITLNGGFMPASVDSLIKAGEYRVASNLIHKGTYGNVINMNDSTVLNSLGDWLYLPREIPLSTAFSLGDLLILIGLVFFFGMGMVKKEPT
ncbi:MAG: DUF5317 family protein [Candidatus Bipolaricaulota bacterium]